MSTAGVIGPVLVNYVRETQIAAGVPRASVYDFMLYILAGLLALGFICNLLVHPLEDRWLMKEEELAVLQRTLRAGAVETTGSMGIGAWRLNLASVLAWVAVAIPPAWVVWITFSNALVLFG